MQCNAKFRSKVTRSPRCKSIYPFQTCWLEMQKEEQPPGTLVPQSSSTMTGIHSLGLEPAQPGPSPSQVAPLLLCSLESLPPRLWTLFFSFLSL